MPKDYGGGPGLKTGSSWGGTMASGPSGGMAQAYGTRMGDGRVSWNGINGNPSYTGYGDYYSAGIPRAASQTYQAPVKRPTYKPVKPVTVVNPKPQVHHVQPNFVAPSKFYGPNYGPNPMPQNWDVTVPGGQGVTGIGPGWASAGTANGVSGGGYRDPYGGRFGMSQQGPQGSADPFGGNRNGWGY